MSKQELVMVLDCGATNIRTAAVNRKGEIIDEKSFPNRPVSQPGGKGAPSLATAVAKKYLL